MGTRSVRLQGARTLPKPGLTLCQLPLALSLSRIYLWLATFAWRVRVSSRREQISCVAPVPIFGQFGHQHSRLVADVLLRLHVRNLADPPSGQGRDNRTVCALREWCAFFTAAGAPTDLISQAIWVTQASPTGFANLGYKCTPLPALDGND
jgi:hypothetical protein